MYARFRLLPMASVLLSAALLGPRTGPVPSPTSSRRDIWRPLGGPDHVVVGLRPNTETGLL